MNKRLESKALAYFLTLPYTRSYTGDFTNTEGPIDYFINMYELWDTCLNLPVRLDTSKCYFNIPSRVEYETNEVSQVESIMNLPCMTAELDYTTLFNKDNYDMFLKYVKKIYFAALRSYLVLLCENSALCVMDFHITFPAVLQDILYGDTLDRLYAPQSSFTLPGMQVYANRINMIDANQFNMQANSLYDMDAVGERRLTYFRQLMQYLYTEDNTTFNLISCGKLKMLLLDNTCNTVTNGNSRNLFKHLLRSFLILNGYLCLDSMSSLYNFLEK